MKIMDFFNSLKSRIRYPIEFLKFKRCGNNVWLGGKGFIGRPSEITFGSNVFINKGFHISARDLVFGDNIMIGPNLVIECDDHVFDDVGVSMFENRNKRKIGPVKIENDVWMGANVTVLKGVVVGEGSVIGANSLITKNIPPYTINAGAPCRPIRRRFSDHELEKHLNSIDSQYSFEKVILHWRAAEVVK